MPYIQEQSAGGAFVDSLESYMQRRELQQRQAEQDAMVRAREERLDRQAQAELALREKEADERIRDKRIAQTEKAVQTMEPGDIPPPRLVQDAHELSIPIRLAPPKPVQPAAPAGIAAMEPSTAPEVIPEGTGVMPNRPQAEIFQGSQKQRNLAEATQIANSVANLDPSSPEAMQAARRYEMLTEGKSLPPSFFKSAATEVQPVYRQNPRTGAIEKVGEVPKGAHFMTEPPPKDTSAQDIRKENMRNQAHQYAITEIDKSTTPLSAQLENLGNAEEVLAVRSPSGDAHVAPMVLKALVSGQGSGFRMTQSEINQVINSRSKWQQLEATLRKWNTDPSQALLFDDAQRADLKDLINTVQKRAQAKYQKISSFRKRINASEDIREIQSLQTDLQDALTGTSADTSTGSQEYDLEYDPKTRTFTRHPKSGAK